MCRGRPASQIPAASQPQPGQLHAAAPAWLLVPDVLEGRQRDVRARARALRRVLPHARVPGARWWHHRGVVWCGLLLLFFSVSVRALGRRSDHEDGVASLACIVWCCAGRLRKGCQLPLRAWRCTVVTRRTPHALRCAPQHAIHSCLSITVVTRRTPHALRCAPQHAIHSCLSITVVSRRTPHALRCAPQHAIHSFMPIYYSLCDDTPHLPILLYTYM